MSKCDLCKKQSPIDIITKDARYQEFRPFELKNYEDFSLRKNNLQVTNNGATVKLVSTRDYELPTLTGGPLNVAYEFVEVHFHWGDDESENGSEHKLDGKSFPMEMHIVHKNIHDETIEEALTHKNGLAVLGFKFAVVDDAKRVNPGMDTLTSLARKHLVNPGDVVQGDKLPLDKDVAIINFLPLLLDCYFYYSGSLTTGTCSEAVNWIVFKNPLAIHKDNLRDFQSLMGEQGKKLVNNYRPVQPRNGRPLYYHGGEFLKSGTVSKGTGKTARSHETPNQRDYLLTVPAPMLTEIAPLAMSHLSENAKKIVAGIGNRSVYEVQKYGMIWYKKVMDKKRKRAEREAVEALRKELAEKNKEIDKIKEASRDLEGLNVASETIEIRIERANETEKQIAEKEMTEKMEQEYETQTKQWKNEVERLKLDIEYLREHSCPIRKQTRHDGCLKKMRESRRG